VQVLDGPGRGGAGTEDQQPGLATTAEIFAAWVWFGSVEMMQVEWSRPARHCRDIDPLFPFFSFRFVCGEIVVFVTRLAAFWVKHVIFLAEAAVGCKLRWAAIFRSVETEIFWTDGRKTGQAAAWQETRHERHRAQIRSPFYWANGRL
jgi:hypothetical protein